MLFCGDCSKTLENTTQKANTNSMREIEELKLHLSSDYVEKGWTAVTSSLVNEIAAVCKAEGAYEASKYFERKMPFCASPATFNNVLQRICEEVRHLFDKAYEQRDVVAVQAD